MKKENIISVMAKDLGSTDIEKLNELLKSKEHKDLKYKLMGKKLGYLGYTVNIKNIANDGLKIFLANKVKLIRFEDIETFEKAKPRVARPVRPKKVPIVNKKAGSAKSASQSEESAAEVKEGAEDPKDVAVKGRVKVLGKPNSKISGFTKFIPIKYR